MSATNVSQFGIFEQSLAASGSYANPYAEASATATLLRPGGGTMTIPLFWDGGATWRLRFSPDATGTWSWSISSTDSDLNGQSGQFSVVAGTLKGGIRRRAATPHHFEYQDGTPFWFFGDTNFGMMADNPAENSTRSTIQAYVKLRASQGFNVIHAELVNHGGWSANIGGEPFSSYSAEAINPAYWQEVDGRIGDLNAADITASLFLAWNDSDPSPPSWKSFASDAARLRYARYVVARYSAFNVLFVVVGEWQESGSDAPIYQAIGSEIAASDPHDRPVAIHCTPDPGTVEPQFATASWMSFGDFQQRYTDLHQGILNARVYDKPVINAEYAYYLRDMDGDGIVDKPNSATLEQIRHATWDIVMAGGYFVTGWGTTYWNGLRDPGPFHPDDPRNDDWEENVQHIRRLFTSVPWWELEPADARVTGPGTHYCLAAGFDRHLIYVRQTTGPVSLSLQGTPRILYAVERFDPRTGIRLLLPEHQAPVVLSISPPDNQDWVYLVAAVPGSLVATGDFDRDNDVDQADFGRLQGCLTQSPHAPSPGCEIADLDLNGRINQADVTLLRACMNGPQIDPPSNCFQD
ncbi:MAG: apiosidase-like domain-containing protein [Phycisphaerae bacterium]